MKSLHHRGWRCQVIPTYADPAILDRFITIRNAIRRGEATVIQDTGGRVVAVIRLSAHGQPVPLLFKEDDLMRSSFRTLLKSHLRPSHVHKSWRHTLQLRAAGIPVPAPVALLERRRWGILQTTVYAGEYLPNALSLALLLRREDVADTDRDSLLATLAKELRFMHDQGFYHGDLKADNILAERRSDRWIITFIDLEGVMAKQCLTEEDRAIDLGRLWWALMPLTTPAIWTRFLEAYSAIAPSIDPLILKQLIDRRVDYLKTRRFGALPRIGALLQNTPHQPQRWLIIALEPPQRVFHATPLLTTLRRRFPSLQLDLLVNGRDAALIAQHPDMRVMTVLPDVSMLSTIRMIRATHYHAVIDLTNRFRSAVLTRATGAKIRIGYRTASTLSKWMKRATCYTQMIMARPEQREPSQHYHLVAEALGLGRVKTAPQESLSSEDRPAAAHSVQGGRV